MVAEDHLTAQERAARGSFSGCIAGALSRREYLQGLAAAGFEQADVRFTHEAAPQMHAAIITATKPTDPWGAGDASPVAEACCGAVEQDSCCASPGAGTGADAGSASCGCR